MATDVTPIPSSDAWERRQWIVSVVERSIDFDLKPVQPDLLEKLEEPSDEYIWPRAERIAGDAIDVIWGPTLLEQCAQGLQEAHHEFLKIAEMCDAAAEDLERNGLDSWIASAIRHQKGFDVCWDTLDERHGVEWHECDDGQGE